LTTIPRTRLARRSAHSRIPGKGVSSTRAGTAARPEQACGRRRHGRLLLRRSGRAVRRLPRGGASALYRS